MLNRARVVKDSQQLVSREKYIFEGLINKIVTFYMSTDDFFVVDVLLRRKLNLKFCLLL